jgi:hypothetical protein
MIGIQRSVERAKMEAARSGHQKYRTPYRSLASNRTQRGRYGRNLDVQSQKGEGGKERTRSYPANSVTLVEWVKSRAPRLRVPGSLA